MPDIGQFDVIFLRNVMIYVDLETKRQVIRRICRRCCGRGLFVQPFGEPQRRLRCAEDRPPVDLSQSRRPEPMPMTRRGRRDLPQPGEWYFGDKHTRIRTVLGSCVSAVFWHPGARVVACATSCCPPAVSATAAGPTRRYGDEAFGPLLGRDPPGGAGHQRRAGAALGGGDMFPGVVSGATSKSVGRQNVEAALRLVERHRLLCSATHVEGYGHRHLIFDVWAAA